MTTTHIIDDLHPEDIAMLQALYSRSPASVLAHLAKVKDVGSGKFMDTYYVGYGHASIGDCGVTSIFQEGVSMLTAKAIQDWPLYSGQEASTRYMDFSSAVFHNPAATEDGAQIQARWRAFYLKAQDPVITHLHRVYPRKPDEAEGVYERAIKARSFDVLRGFLPAGAATNVSWTSNLRQLSDKLDGLRVHPHPLVRKAAQAMHGALREKYPHSFREGEPRNAEYIAWSEFAALLLPDMSVAGHGVLAEREQRLAEVRVRGWFDEQDIALRDPSMLALLRMRPKGALVPRHLGELGQIQSEFTLDFGSFRDLQRHRNGVIRMPLLTTVLGFHPWYLDQMPQELRAEACDLIGTQGEAIEALDVPDVCRQDYVAMGYRVPCRVTQTLPAFIYRLELRSSKSVHPTLRQVVLQEAEAFRGRFPGVALYVDDSPDDWSARRGEQTITEKDAGEQDGREEIGLRARALRESLCGDPDRAAGAAARVRATGAWENWTQEDIDTELRGVALLTEGSPNMPQPRPEPSEHPAVWDLVMADIRERDAMGQAKYGQRLKPHDGRDNLADIYQESLDRLVYIRKELYERNGR